MERLYKQFEKPGLEYRGKPFWAWNGKLEKEELVRQIHVMKEMGFGGFFMHSRAGLVTEYLGEEWFDLISTCADEAEALGMETWLYDEDRWPSGTAGGMVTVEPKYRLKFVLFEIIPAEWFKWDDTILVAFSCKLKDDFACYDYKHIYKETPSISYKCMDILKFSVVEMEKSAFYNGYTYVDTLNREATDRFIELTHEKYKKYCGDRLGKSIKGIFTDEPYRGTLMDGFAVSNRNKEWLAPWTYSLFDNFKSKYGYDLIECLPELFLKFEGKDVSQVKWHYVELLQEMFLDNFAKPIHDWCKKNNIILTGHILHEDSLTAQTVLSGSVMRYYEYMDYPGVDVLTEGNLSFWIVKQLSSAARQLGKKWLLSELYGCTGWQMTFESHKAVGDWQALFGINLRCQHLSWYTMEGEAKRDYPGSILHQSTWWKEYNQVETYFSRLGYIMSQGKPCCDILVVNPVESLWGQVYPGWSKNLSACSTEVQKLEEVYAELFRWLCGSQIDFDYGDEDMLHRLHGIEKRDDNVVLMVGDASYKCVVVSGMTTIRSTTLEVLRKFIDAGGKVIFAGNPPAYVDAVESVMVRKISEESIYVSFDKDSIVNTIRQCTGIKVGIVDRDTGKPMEEIYCQIRDDGERKYLMALNINRERWLGNAEIRIYENRYVEEWNCRTGERFSVPAEQKNGYMIIKTDFPPCGEHLYILTKEKSETLCDKTNYEVVESHPCKGSYDFKLSEQNVCVLDMAKFKLDDEEWQDEEEILKVDRVVRRKLGLDLRGWEMVQPWFAQKSSCGISGQLKLGFGFIVKNLPEEMVELAMERPDKFTVKLNGYPIETAGTSGWWADRCMQRIMLSLELFNEGENVIELATVFHEEINLEAVYLLGNFGVELKGSMKILTRLPQKLAIGDLVLQGMPFYSGAVIYKLIVDNIPNNPKKMFISIENFSAACINVISKGKAPLLIAWQPYEADITDYIGEDSTIELEVLLTRRNTFGPLHHVPLLIPFYGPDSFITEGNFYTNSYMLIPSGILSTPNISIRG